jgi:23S rRNA (adenine2503-C2)-methyltransferase
MSIFKVDVLESSDTRVKKLVFTSKDAVAEAVLYKYPEYIDRTVICCSVQSGCAVGCSFCGTGKQFIRNLTDKEIIYQVQECLQLIDCNPLDINKLQIMFMSMGEPFHNYRNLESAIVSLNKLYPNASLLVSTSAPEGNNTSKYVFNELASKIDKIGLQFSVHESTDEARRNLIPTRTMSLKDISNWGIDFLKKTGRRPFFNYCVHKNNSSDKDVLNLLSIFNPEYWECTLSVICEADETIHESKNRQQKLIQDFSQKMLEVGYSIRIFDPAGQDDIGGGCGQLWATQRWLKDRTNKD